MGISYFNWINNCNLYKFSFCKIFIDDKNLVYFLYIEKDLYLCICMHFFYLKNKNIYVIQKNYRSFK
jgi:hypothetical protein